MIAEIAINLVIINIQSQNSSLYDIRNWNEKHDRMGKGVTLTEAELRKLKELLDAEIAILDNSASG
ncbi:MAG: hypothetical protein GX825_00690 [Syntrophomonadaceae bacterium]|nr:hypothetical protein [Syntrophomonadaceae bacterium]